MSAERRAARAMKAVMAQRLIVERLGPMTSSARVEEVRIACLGAVAEVRGIWDFLIARGLATEAQHQDFLDRGYDSMLQQVQGAASKIFVHDAGNG